MWLWFTAWGDRCCHAWGPQRALRSALCIARRGWPGKRNVHQGPRESYKICSARCLHHHANNTAMAEEVCKLTCSNCLWIKLSFHFWKGKNMSWLYNLRSFPVLPLCRELMGFSTEVERQFGKEYTKGESVWKVIVKVISSLTVCLLLFFVF